MAAAVFPEVVDLPIGTPVQYLSRSRNVWFDAIVTGHRPGKDFFQLDLQSMAYCYLVRPLPPGSETSFFSRPTGGWIDSVVRGFDFARLLYDLDVQPGVNPALVRPRHSVQAVAPVAAASPVERFHGGESADDIVLPAVLPQPQRQAPKKAAGGGYDLPNAGRRKAPSGELLIPLPIHADRKIMRQFKCPLCMDETRLDEGVCLDCNHQLCADCFGGYCNSKIADGKVTEKELVCPATVEGTKLCGTPITVDQVRAHVSTEVFDKLCRFRTAIWEPDQKDGRLVRCPTPECISFVVSAAEREVNCPACKKVLCPLCCREAHRGFTCEEWSRKLQTGPKTEEEKQLEGMIRAQGWMRCPKCDTPTELSGGCFFMKCESDKCRGTSHFCYLCGEFLRGEDHLPGRSLAHFPRGPYNMECINVSEEEYKRRLEEQGRDHHHLEEANPLVAIMQEARRFLEL
eukprot:TRINITY_DN58760_c0_g1_i1.p1 TRINITY_DN58760_c0_g1~~TRINITY_DN58760_c0_g1_i1.p1  ORF type:complete len:458 (+),score=73.94 TRINITY_DN58760_c0_g1_i1:103-1476(+)